MSLRSSKQVLLTSSITIYLNMLVNWLIIYIFLYLQLHRNPKCPSLLLHSSVTFFPMWCQFTLHFRIQFISVAQSCPTLCNPINRSTPGLPVHHQLPEFTQTHVHQVSDAIQPLSPSPPALNPSQHQGLFQWVNSSHEVAKVLKFQLQHQSFQWTPRTDLL